MLWINLFLSFLLIYFFLYISATSKMHSKGQLTNKITYYKKKKVEKTISLRDKIFYGSPDAV